MNSGAKLVLLIFAIAIAVVAGLVLFTRPMLLKPPPPKPTVASEIAKIRASGAPVHIVELGYPRVPENRNAAPIYEKAFKELAAAPEADVDAIAHLIFPEDRKKDPALPARARQALSRCHRAVALAEKAAERPECQFKHDWSKGSLVIEFPEYRWLRELSRVLAAEAVLSAVDGDTERAIQLVRLGLKTSATAEASRTLIAFLVRLATLKITLKALEQVTQLCAVNDRHARDISLELARIDLTSHLLRAIEGERPMGIWVFDEARRGHQIFLSPIVPSDLDKDELFYLRQMASHLEMSRMRYRVIKRMGQDDFPEVPDYARISNMLVLVPSPGRTTAHRDSAEAQVALAQTALALGVYHKRHGSYPRSIGELRSRLRWSIPADPFSGKDLVYKRTTTGYVLYSIGEDLRDDGGRPFRVDKGDIVWGKLP